MTRSETIAAVKRAKLRGDTRGQNKAEREAREATHAVLSKPRWKRWADGVKLLGFRGQYKNKRDDNEKEVVAAFRAMGCTVERLDQPVDLLVGCKGVTRLVEVKAPGKGLNETQKKWFDKWDGCLFIVRSTSEAIELAKFWRQ